MQGLTQVTSTSLIVLGGCLSGTNMTWSFAKGVSFKYASILAQYQDNAWFKPGLKIIQVTQGVVTLVPVMELAIYIRLFKTLNQSNKENARMLPKALLKQRKQRNVLTLSGQFYCYILETIVINLGNLMLTSIVNHPLLDPSMFPIFVIIGSTIETIGKYWASPDMREFFFPKFFNQVISVEDVRINPKKNN